MRSPFGSKLRALIVHPPDPNMVPHAEPQDYLAANSAVLQTHSRRQETCSTCFNCSIQNSAPQVNDYRVRNRETIPPHRPRTHPAGVSMRNVPLHVAVRPEVEVAVTVTEAGKPGFPAPWIWVGLTPCGDDHEWMRKTPLPSVSTYRSSPALTTATGDSNPSNSCSFSGFTPSVRIDHTRPLQ